MSPMLSSFLNASRWLAALLVATAHIRWVLIGRASASDAGSKSPIVQLFYFITGLGNEAVMIFFVISGYLVAGRLIATLSKKGFDLRSYAAHRISRIYVVLIPALLIGGSFDLIGANFFNRSGLYNLPMFTNEPVSMHLTVPILLGNLFMVEGLFTPKLGSNLLLWSLMYEWWYYCIFAAVMVLLTYKKIPARVSGALALVCMLVILPKPLLAWMLIWSIGALVAIFAAKSTWRPNVWASYLVFIATVVMSRVWSHTDAMQDPASASAFLRNALIGLGFALLLLSNHRTRAALPFARLHETLAGCSYSLYLTHFPLMILCVAIASDVFGLRFQQPLSLTSLLSFALLVAFVGLYALGFSQFTEARTAKVRDWLMSFGRASKKPSVIDSRQRSGVDAV